jgi:hypothetical protein
MSSTTHEMSAGYASLLNPSADGDRATDVERQGGFFATTSFGCWLAIDTIDFPRKQNWTSAVALAVIYG